MSRLKNRTHFGMAGHYAAMSAFLLRGWNVAVPAVDIGDDVLVLDDDEGAVRRVQVKTANGEESRDTHGHLVTKVVQYTLSRAQLATAKEVELHYMLMVLWDHRWRFIVIRRDVLHDARQQFMLKERKGPGRPPVSDGAAKADDLALKITWRADDAEGWGTSFAAGLDSWPDDFPELRVDPPPRAPEAPPSPDPGTQPALAPSSDPPKVP